METEFDNTLRVCDTETLLRLMREGREQQYNRTCPPELPKAASEGKLVLLSPVWQTVSSDSS